MNTEEKLAKSRYERWLDKEFSQYGSFHTALLNAYRLADSSNRERLEQVFPEWFLPSYYNKK